MLKQKLIFKTIITLTILVICNPIYAEESIYEVTDTSIITIKTNNSSSDNNNTNQTDIQHSKLNMITLGIIYSLIFVVGNFGNSLVIYVVCRTKSMQSVTNLFIMNLALSDILMCTLAVPFTPIQ
jgi:hypothetical protein